MTASHNHEQRDDHGGAWGRALSGAGEHRDHLPVRVRSVRGQGLTFLPDLPGASVPGFFASFHAAPSTSTSLTTGGRSRMRGCAFGRQTGARKAVRFGGVISNPAILSTGHFSICERGHTPSLRARRRADALWLVATFSRPIPCCGGPASGGTGIVSQAVGCLCSHQFQTRDHCLRSFVDRAPVRAHVSGSFRLNHAAKGFRGVRTSFREAGNVFRG